LVLWSTAVCAALHLGSWDGACSLYKEGLQGALLLALTRGLWKSVCTGAGICSVQGVL